MCVINKKLPDASCVSCVGVSIITSDVDDWNLKLEGVEPKSKFLQCLNNWGISN